MSKLNNRGTLMGLKYNLPAMPKAAPVALTPEMEQQILHHENHHSLHKDVGASGAAGSAPGYSNRKKEPTVLMNAKLPVRLHSRLKRTAQFNDLSMTDILIRAIEAELATGLYTAPPETWGSDPLEK